MIAGESAVAGELAAAAEDAGWDVAEPAEAEGEVPFLIVDCGDEGRRRRSRAVPRRSSSTSCRSPSSTPRGTGFHARAAARPPRRAHRPAGTAAAERFFATLGMHAEHVADAPGLVLGRIVAQLVNEAYFALGEGIGSAEDIDAGMELGLNHPRGPLEWGELWGLDAVLAVLDGLHAEYREERWRPAPALRRSAARSTARSGYACSAVNRKSIASVMKAFLRRALAGGAAAAMLAAPTAAAAAPEPPMRCPATPSPPPRPPRAAPGSSARAPEPPPAPPRAGSARATSARPAPAATRSRRAAPARSRPRSSAAACSSTRSRTRWPSRTARVPPDPLSGPPDNWRDVVADPSLVPPAVDAATSPLIALVDAQLEPAHAEWQGGNTRDAPAVPGHQLARHGDRVGRRGAGQRHRDPRRLAGSAGAERPAAGGDHLPALG